MKNRAIFIGIIIFASIFLIIFISAFGITLLIGGKMGIGGEKIAIINIKGIIVDSKSTVKEIRKYADNPSVKAILIRVDSPGGGVVASQEIYEALKWSKEIKQKKVITSMGTVAASGGYYVACASDLIVANPGTLTGSIGVIMEFASLEGLFRKIGVEGVVIKSGKHKDIGSPFRGLTKEERELLQGIIDDVYVQFVNAVAEGRRMKPEAVRGFADGRIFTGRQAKELGLVDELGTMQDAINLAAKLGGIKGEPDIIEKERGFSVLDLLKEEFWGTIGDQFKKNHINLQYRYIL
ncbi:MAG: signal peptide peptidase SppA [Nitrospirae bacterium]|nr:signal peptide peptidase SppA [Nitrospirota bacterium]